MDVEGEERSSLPRLTSPIQHRDFDHTLYYLREILYHERSHRHTLAVTVDNVSRGTHKNTLSIDQPNKDNTPLRHLSLKFALPISVYSFKRHLHINNTTQQMDSAVSKTHPRRSQMIARLSCP